MVGVALGARFSLATNRLRYCGPPGSEDLLYGAATEGRNPVAARAALEKFEALMPYLEAIGRKNGRDPFDPEVVEAYWIGNELLDAFDRSDFLDLLDRLVARGLPRSIARGLAERLPPDPIPHHVFHVAFVGVGNVTGHVATTLANMEACRPSWGTVRSIHDGSFEAEGPALARGERGLEIGAAHRATHPWDPRLLPDLAVGDMVAFHWSMPVLRLSPDRATRLRAYTERSLSAANGARPAERPPAPGTGRLSRDPTQGD